MKRTISFFIFLLLTIPVYAKDSIMRFHGSNTVGAELAPKLIKNWLKQTGYMVISDRETAAQERAIIATNGTDQLTIEIQAHGSSTSFKSLYTGLADIGMSSRPIKDKELHMLGRLGQFNKPNTEYIIAIDGLAILVNKNNPLKAISKEKLKDIFTGKITNWAQLGLAPAHINVYARDNKSGTYDTFKSLVMGKKTPLIKTARRYESNARLSDDVANDINGIGFTGLAYIRNTKALSVSEPDSIALYPSPFNVATEDYTLSRRLYMYVPEKNRHPLADSFVKFAGSNSGQNIAAQVGFVSQAVFAIDAMPIRHLPQEYQHLTKDAKRLSLNVRFKESQVKLDNKAMHDVNRLVDFMRHPDNANKRIMLMGFSDSHEALPYYSLALSIDRADSVADKLTKMMIAPDKVRGFGHEVPVSSNETSQGRMRNRRVEVWVHDSQW